MYKGEFIGLEYTGRDLSLIAFRRSFFKALIVTPNVGRNQTGLIGKNWNVSSYLLRALHRQVTDRLKSITTFSEFFHWNYLHSPRIHPSLGWEEAKTVMTTVLFAHLSNPNRIRSIEISWSLTLLPFWLNMLEISPLHLIKYLEFVFWRHFHVLKDPSFSSPVISGHRQVDKLTLRLVPSLQGEY